MCIHPKFETPETSNEVILSLILLGRKRPSWVSYRPDASLRYSGKVESITEGRAHIQYFGGGVAPNLRCRTRDWVIEQCDSVYGGKTRSGLRLKDFARSLSENENFQFMPEKCGGYSQSFDVSPFTDRISGSLDINFRVKGSCRELGLATSVKCRADVRNVVWSARGCESTSFSDHDFQFFFAIILNE